VNDPRFESDIATLREILAQARTIAVVGLSQNWHRPSNFAAKYLKHHGYRIIPVNPMYDEVLGERCYPSLSAIPEAVDIVDCFRKAEDIPPLAEEAIAIGARVLWMQLGIVHLPAATMAANAGLKVVMDRCIKIEHARLFGGLNFVGVNTRVVSSKRPKTIVN
jgi:uncharacterized protein